ncbi:gp436 family protein [Aeromonas veronii]|uniref:gp436 family protein n=1 Tax=Aeromonas veronii TaxID=654 RepID=UPI001F3C2E4E|nr:DUF1320 domain-containing protein [Aeromonas veronii]
MYASVNDMVSRFGEAELLRLAMTPTGELDEVALRLALQDAGALIDGYLAGRYPLPLAHIPSALVPICADIARHRLYGEQAPEQIAKRNEAALAFLKSVGKGSWRWGWHPMAPPWRARIWLNCSRMGASLAGVRGATRGAFYEPTRQPAWYRTRLPAGGRTAA